MTDIALLKPPAASFLSCPGEATTTGRLASPPVSTLLLLSTPACACGPSRLPSRDTASVGALAGRAAAASSPCTRALGWHELVPAPVRRPGGRQAHLPCGPAEQWCCGVPSLQVSLLLSCGPWCGEEASASRWGVVRAEPLSPKHRFWCCRTSGQVGRARVSAFAGAGSHGVGWCSCPQMPSLPAPLVLRPRLELGQGFPCPRPQVLSGWVEAPQPPARQSQAASLPVILRKDQAPSMTNHRKAQDVAETGLSFRVAPRVLPGWVGCRQSCVLCS